MANKMIYGMVFALLLTLCFVSAEVYDDFSGSSLDTSLWTETTDTTASGDLDEFYLDTTNQNYHTAQLTAGDRGILLLLNQEFQAGDTLTYEVDYQDGSGNIIGREYINGNYLDLIIGTSLSYPEYATTGVIGYWNGVSEVGSNEFGNYDISVTFNEDSADFSITAPNGTIWEYTATGLTAPYIYGVATRTGGDGTGHIDYDNFELTSTEDSSCSCTELEAQVESLEDTVATLQAQLATIESEIDDHETRISSLESAIRFISRRVNILWRIARP